MKQLQRKVDVEREAKEKWVKKFESEVKSKESKESKEPEQKEKNLFYS